MNNETSFKQHSKDSTQPIITITPLFLYMDSKVLYAVPPLINMETAHLPNYYYLFSWVAVGEGVKDSMKVSKV